MRVVQPRLSAIQGVQRADILGARTFAMRIWLKPDRMAALNISPAQVRQALAANNFLAALGRSKGAYIQVNLTADTNLSTVEEFKRLVVREQNGTIVRLGDIADVVLGAEDYDTEVHFSGQTAVFMGIWPLPNANSLDVIKRVRTEMASIQRDLPTGLQGPRRLRRHQLHHQRHPRGAQDPGRHAADRHGRHLPLPRLLPLGADTGGGDPGVADRRRLPDAGLRLHRQPAHPAGHRPLGRSGGRRRHRRGGERRAPSAAKGKSPLEAALVGARELVGPIIAMTITLAAVYLPIGLQGGLTGSLFREFAFTLAGAVTISGIVALTLSPVMSAKLLKPGDEEHGLAGRITRDFERLKNAYGRLLDATLAARPAVYAVWIVVSLLTMPMFIMSAKELAPTEDQGVIFGILDASANSTLDQNSRFAAEVNRVFQSVPETDFTFQITFPNSGFGGMVVKPWDERKRNIFQILPEVQQKLQKIPGIQIFPVTPPALPGGGNFPVEFIMASTADTGQILEFANQLQMKAMQSGMFAFPPLIDVKIDQPQSEFVIDRDKVASLGLNLGQIGGDLGGHGRRRLRQPLRHLRPQLQGHPADRAGRPSQPRPAQGYLRHRSGRQADPA